jgi:hypothetical protein
LSNLKREPRELWERSRSHCGRRTLLQAEWVEQVVRAVVVVRFGKSVWRLACKASLWTGKQPSVLCNGGRPYEGE